MQEMFAIKNENNETYPKALLVVSDDVHSTKTATQEELRTAKYLLYVSSNDKRDITKKEDNDYWGNLYYSSLSQMWTICTSKFGTSGRPMLYTIQTTDFMEAISMILSEVNRSNDYFDVIEQEVNLMLDRK